MTTSPETPPERPRISGAAAVLIAFVSLAVVDAVFIEVGHRAKGVVRLWHHLFDAGHFVFLGALVALAVTAWSAARSRSPWLGSRRFASEALLGALGIAVAWLRAREDFAGFASEAGGERGGPFLLAALLLVVGLSPAIAFAFASRIARIHRLAVVPLGIAGLGAAIANNLVLLADYPGVHLFVALDATVLIAVALAHTPRPRYAAKLTEHPRAALAPVALLVLAAPSVVIKPNNAVRTQLARIEGSIFVPVLADVAWSTETEAQVTGIPKELEPWMVDRRKGKAIAPSGPSLLPKDPIVLLIGIDSLRADLFDYEDSIKKMPHLIALRDKALSFTMARSPGSRTITTWSQVFSGRYVSGLKWKGDGNRLSIADDRTKRFSDYLHDQGVRTTTYVSYGALGKSGLARQFDEVVDIKPREGQPFGLSADVVPKLVDAITAKHEGPRFFFAHFMDAHYPYDAAGKKGNNRARFLSEVALADESVGKIWDALETNQLLDRTVLVVTADHGEGLGEHDNMRHTVNLYEELIRVPLFIVIPGVKPREIDTPVTLMDLGPTFLDLFSIKTPASFLGQSLLPFARGEDPVLTRPIAAERAGTRTMIFGNRKVILEKAKGRQEIYDLAADPDESKNLADDLGEEGQHLFGMMRTFFDAHGIPQ